MEPNTKTGIGIVKTFTIDEVNQLLPSLSNKLRDVLFLNERIKSLGYDMENLVSIWGNDLMEKGHTDYEYYFWMISEREKIFQQLTKNVGDIQALGCIIKDIDNGLVDFYYDNEGELVFLCWKYGEDKIRHWHTIDTGFQDRRDVKKLK
ncbi:MAG: DUF2203 domain-containing protein [Candidatus Aenigmatarchaeota archaeon]